MVGPGVPHPAFTPTAGSIGFVPANPQTAFQPPTGFLSPNPGSMFVQPNLQNSSHFLASQAPFGMVSPFQAVGQPQPMAVFHSESISGPWQPQPGPGIMSLQANQVLFQGNPLVQPQMGFGPGFQSIPLAPNGYFDPNSVNGGNSYHGVNENGHKTPLGHSKREPNEQDRDPELQKYLAEAREKGIEPEQDTLLSWLNLDVLVNEKGGCFGLKKKPNPKQILFGTNGFAKSGECLAIMGGSGSGKSTLLNILSGRNQTSTDYIVKGEVTINGIPVNYKKYKKVTGFVMQSDIFLEMLTVEEYFRFAIDLKQFDKTPEQRELAVDEMIKLLKLERARKNKVGGKTIKGISGGEKKRLNIGFELLSNPRIIYLDEPTSGLDSYTSFIIVDVMRKLARARNLIIIYTIHQPSVDCFKLFDNLLILNRGKIVYFGSAANSMNYYASLESPVPSTKNPTNHYIEMAMRSSPETLESFYSAHQQQQIPAIVAESAKHSGQEINYKTVDPGFFRQFIVLFMRAVRNYFRNKINFIMQVVQTLFIALLYCLLYARIGDFTSSDPIEKGLAERTYGGALFFACVNQFIMYFMNVLVVFPAERATFAKESTSGYYNVAPYYFSKLLVELPVVAVFPMIWLAIVYFIIGFVPDAGRFFLFAVGLVLLAIWGTLMGILIGCIVHNGSLAVEIAPLVFVPFLLFAGFSQNTENVPGWMIWIMYISPMRYMFEWCIRSQFQGLNDEYIEQLNFHLGYGAIIGIAIGYMLVLIALSVFALKFGSKSIKN